MAKMFPEKFPIKIEEERKPSSERAVYTALSDLPNDYYVFYNINWQQINDCRVPIESEADFIIVHAEKGILILEVKGGGIVYDAKNDLWSSQDRNGQVHIIKDPVRQGVKTKHWLLNELKKMTAFKNIRSRIWNSVCFPDTSIPTNTYLKTDLDRRQILDHHDLKEIKKSINQIFDFLFQSDLSGEPPGVLGMEALVTLLGASFTLKSPLSIQLNEEEQELIQLTENQYKLFSWMGKRKNVAISGCAGSGKTMLGLMRAQRLSDIGLGVLFLCYNKPLADFLKPKLENGTVITFHGLCEKAAKELEKRDYRSDNSERLFTEIYPSLLIEYAEKNQLQFDAIIVDEAQDFHENYWMAVASLLKPDSYLYIFFDDNQNIFEGDTTFQGLISSEPFELFENCRNTRLIHDDVRKFHATPKNIESNAPLGREPRWINYSTNEELKIGIRKELDRLHNKNNVDLEKIIILTTKSETNSIFKEGLKLGNFIISWKPVSKNIVEVSTIHSFKGLERSVVIIAELDNQSPDLEKLLYIGCSRAKTELTCFYKDNIENILALQMVIDSNDY